MRPRHRVFSPAPAQSGIAALELALFLVVLAPLTFTAVELAGLIRADFALRALIRAGAQAPVLAPPTDWRASTLATVVRTAALANLEGSSLPGFTNDAVTTSVRCTCPTDAGLSASRCTDWNAAALDEFACPDTGGSYTPPRIYVEVTASYRYAVSLLPSSIGQGGITLTRNARVRLQ